MTYIHCLQRAQLKLCTREDPELVDTDRRISVPVSQASCIGSKANNLNVPEAKLLREMKRKTTIMIQSIEDSFAVYNLPNYDQLQHVN